MPEEELNRLVAFKLANEEFGVDVMEIKEIATPTTITRVPKSPDYIEGVFNLRGSLTPLINLRKRFGFESKEIDSDTRIVIAELEDRYIGMLVDSATEVVRIPSEDIEATPELVTTRISKNYLKGVGKIEDRLIIILDLKQVLTRKEVEEMRAFEEKNIKKIKERKKEKETAEQPEKGKTRGKSRNNK